MENHTASVELKVTFETPRVPNFVRAIYSDNQEQVVSVGNLDDGILDVIAESWKRALYRTRDRLRKNGVK